MTPPVLARVNPYPGLAPFQEQDASRFFGRDREIDEVLDRLASRRLLAVIGVSGCGKSSLVRAGVIPVLRMGVAENLPARWRIHTITPGNTPLKALRSLGVEPVNSFDLVDHARNTLEAGESLLLIVDQFEELFAFRKESLDRDGGNEAALFVNLLLNAVDQRDVPVYILLTMRTDFLGHCAEFRGLPEALNDCYYLVPRMTRLQQQEAIERPLQELGIAMHPALLQRLLNDSAEDPDHLPVLQHLLKRLWENWTEQGGDGPIGLDDYEAVGGWEKALENDAESVLKQFETYDQKIKDLFQWITDRGTGEKPVRRPRPYLECLEISLLDGRRLSEGGNTGRNMARAGFGAIVSAFQERGLLRPSDRSDHSLVDLTHESVMWQWSRLKIWIEEEAASAARLRFLLQAAHREVPLTGLALVAPWPQYFIQRYLKPEEWQETQAWLAHCKRVERARRRRRWWILSAAATLVLVLAVIWMWVTRQQRNSAQARELAAWAAVSLHEDPERSLILGLHAWARQRAMIGGLEQILHGAAFQSRVRLTLRGHKEWVESIAWSPDGSRLATGSSDRTAKVWEAGTGRELLTLTGHENAVMGIAWSPDRSKLATASYDSAKVWEANTGRELLTLRGHQGWVETVAWSPDGTRLATASEDKTARVWESGTGRELLTLYGHAARLKSIAWSPDGTMLATTSEDLTAKVWEAATGRELRTLRGHEGGVYRLAWSPDGKRLATASNDRTVKVWETSSGRELLTWRGHQAPVLDVAWSMKGNSLATASDDNTAKVWDAGTGRELYQLLGHQTPVHAITWSPDASRLATAGLDGTVKVWEAVAGREMLALNAHDTYVWSVTWSPDGSKLATASDDDTAKVWDGAGGHELVTLRGHRRDIRNIAWSPNGSRLATASLDNTANVWEAGSGRELLTLSHQSPVWSVAWSPDGSKLATATSGKMAKVWEAASGRDLLTLGGHQDRVRSIAWSPDGSRLATASEDKTAKVWEAGTGRELATLRGHEGNLYSIAWSPDGTRLATASRDNTAKVWDAVAARELVTLRGHRSIVVTVAWSPDGTRLASASFDNTVKVWEARTGRELFTLRSHQVPALTVAWSPDGKRLASAGGDGMAQVYAIDQTELLRLVRSRITRDLTSDECRRYLDTEMCPPLPDFP
jgi:WD40 repeat protein